MEIHSDDDLPLDVAGSVVTIGAYDGVHLGHRAILAAIRERAVTEGLPSIVVTFDRHPAQVVRPDSAPRLLTNLGQRLELLGSTGIDHAVVIRFDQRRADESAEDFVDELLVGGLHTSLVVVGEDFRFGHRRRGDVDLLTEMGSTRGFEVLGHALVGEDGREARDEANVSSTAIRRALVEGRLDDANRMLGRDHEMRGPVVSGDRRGREIGFPTANVEIAPEMLMPADGIYAGWMRRADGVELPAALYIGHRPTFFEVPTPSLLEVHCLDFSGDLYGEAVAVRLTSRIRGDRRFDSVDALAAQLRDDCAVARKRLL